MNKIHTLLLLSAVVFVSISPLPLCAKVMVNARSLSDTQDIAHLITNDTFPTFVDFVHQVRKAMKYGSAVMKVLNPMLKLTGKASLDFDQTATLIRFYAEPKKQEDALIKIRDGNPEALYFLLALITHLTQYHISNLDQLTLALHDLNTKRLNLQVNNKPVSFKEFAHHLHKKLNSSDYAVPDEEYFTPTACIMFVSHLYINKFITF
jgi:hypothetical protein